MRPGFVLAAPPDARDLHGLSCPSEQLCVALGRTTAGRTALYRSPDGGRSWVTALGHDSAAYVDGSGFVGQAFFKNHLVNGILSAMGNLPFCSGR